MAKNEYHEHLKLVPMFTDLGPHELDVIGQVATQLDFEAGKVLVREGTAAHEMFIVMEGELEVSRGGEHIADIGPGSFAGEMALLTHAPRSATISTKTDVVTLHIDGRSFDTLLDEVPQLAVAMLPIVAARVVENSQDPVH